MACSSWQSSLTIGARGCLLPDAPLQLLDLGGPGSAPHEEVVTRLALPRRLLDGRWGAIILC